MKKILASSLIILGGNLIFGSFIHAEGMTTESSDAAKMEYILKINCDTFTGNSKEYCLEKKKQILENSIKKDDGQPEGRMPTGNERRPEEKRNIPMQASSGSININCDVIQNEELRKVCVEKKGQLLSRGEKGFSGITQQLPQRINMKEENIGMPGKQIINCDLFSGEYKKVCIEKKMQSASGSTNQGKPNQLKQNFLKNEKGQSGGIIKANAPQNDPMTSAIAKLSPEDKKELTKMIRAFLESKGITITPPPTQTQIQ